MDRDTVTQSEGEMVKTTVSLDSNLLERAKIAAIVHKSSLQQLCADGLEMKLRQLDKQVSR
jgi:hypothetical protein